MKILKVKYKKKKKEVHIEYTCDGDSTDTHTIDSFDAPRPELEQSLKACTVDVLNICELEGKIESDITVTGVAFSYAGGKDDFGACIIGMVRLRHSDGPLNVVTPHKASAPYGEYINENQLLDNKTVIRLKLIQEEAIRYINGDRAQQNLNLGNNNGEQF
jgi:hypothetical protein